MLLTGPSIKRSALRINEQELKEIFFQTSLGRWGVLLDRSDEFIDLGSGVSYLDLIDDSGDELDSKTASVPNMESSDVILVIQERGKLFEKNISETSGIEVATNDSGLIHLALFNDDRVAVEFIPRESAEFSCRIMHENAFIDSKYIENTYAEFVDFVNSARNEVTFKEIQGSCYYEEDHSLGGQLHSLLLTLPDADFSTGALEYFDASELITLSLNDGLSDKLAVGLFKHALSMVNSGEGPFEEWSDEDKQHAQIGETVRNNLLGNRSLYMNRNNVYTDTDVIGWFIQNNLNDSTKQAILRNKVLGLDYLRQLVHKDEKRDTRITLHPSWIESKMKEVVNSISEEFILKFYSDDGAVERVTVDVDGETFEGVRNWKSGQFVQQTTKDTLLEYYERLRGKAQLTNEHVQANGDFELGSASEGYWDDEALDEQCENGQVVHVEYSFVVSDLEHDSIPKPVQADVKVCRPEHEIEIYGEVVSEFFDDITSHDYSCSGLVSLSNPDETSLLECLKRANERPSFLVNFLKQLYSTAENWYIAEFELAGESILEGMELEFQIGGFQSFKVNIGELNEALLALQELLSLKNTIVFEDYPVKVSLMGYNAVREKMKKAFIRKYPDLENRFHVKNEILTFEISPSKEISERNWTIDFLESNVDGRRSYNGLGKALDHELYSALYELFLGADGKVYFDTGNEECVVETVGKFDTRYSFTLTKAGLYWTED